MSNSASERSPRERQIDALILEYEQAAEQGHPFDQEQFLREHSEFAAELREYLADVGRMQEAVQPLRAEPDETEPISGSSPSTLKPGMTVRYFGDYEILEELGSGGMGVVYKARQTKLKKIVALKMIKVGQLASDEEVRRFQAEARAAAKLDHPGIVAVHEVGVDHRQHYYAMDFVGGGSLSMLHREGPVAARPAAELVKKLAEAMHYAHGQGIVHRDLKPANVLLATNGTPRITDFGLAKRLWSDDDSASVTMTETGQVLGTAGYMSPEQAAGKTRLVGLPADIYSLGAILYALLTSRAPFVGESQADTILQVIQKEPISPRTLNPSVPRDLETICLKCLEKEPHKRYGTAQLLADDLGRFLERRPVMARPISSAARAWRWCRRNPLVAGLVAALLLALMGGTAASTTFGILAERRAVDAQRAQKSADKHRQVAEKQRDIASSRLYVSDMRLADRAHRENDLARMQRLLEGHHPVAGVDRRGWEWFYLRSEAFGDTLSFAEHESYVTSIAWNPDCKRIASASEDGTVHIWDPLSGKPFVTIPVPGKQPCRLHWNRAGNRLLGQSWWMQAMLGKEDLMVHVWNHESGKLEFSVAGRQGTWNSAGNKLAILLAQGKSGSMGMTPNAAVGRNVVNPTRLGELKIWDAESQALSGVPSWGDPVAAVAWSPDGTKLAIADSKAVVRIAKADSGDTLATLNGHSAPPTIVSFNHDGTQLATAGPDGTIRVWNAALGEQVHSWPGKNAYPVRLDWNSDGKYLTVFAVDNPAYGQNDSVQVYDIVAGKLAFTELAKNFAWSPDSDRLALLLPTMSIGVWSASNWQLQRTMSGHVGSLSEVAWSPDGNRLATGAADRNVKIWNTPARPSQMLTFSIRTTWPPPVAWDPAGKKVAVVSPDRSISVFDYATGERIAPLMISSQGGGVRSMAWNSAGTHLAAGSFTYGAKNGEVKIWDIAKKTATHTVSGANFSFVHWSRDDSRLFMYSPSHLGVDGQLRILDVPRGVELPPAPDSQLGDQIAWSADGSCYAHNLNWITGWTEVHDDQGRIRSKISTVDQDRQGIVVVRDAVTHKELQRLKLPGNVRGLQFDPQYNRLAVAYARDVPVVEIWDLSTRERSCSLETFGDILAFHPTDDRLLTGRGKSLILWDIASGQELLTLDVADKSVYTAAWRPDGKVLATISDRGSAGFWDATKGYEHDSALKPDYFRTRQFGGGGFF